MIKLRCFAAVPVLCWTLLAVVESAHSLECDLYLAESTIPNAGLGAFTAVSKRVGDSIGNGDVVFPVLDLDYNFGVYHFEKNGDFPVGPETLYSPFQDYVWDGIVMGMARETDREADGDFEPVTAFWPGLDCAINCLIPLENIHRAFPRHNSQGNYEALSYMPQRSKHPAAGAITPYRSATKTAVSRDIPSGGELFKHYGDNWFLTRDHTFDQGFPLSNSFPKAQQLLDRYADRWRFPPLADLLLELRGIWSETSRILRAFPANQDDLRLALQTRDITQTYQPNATRSLEWLEEHGTCIDHIVPRPSTIPGAGEGAFAKRSLPNGTRVTASPLIIIPFDQMLEIAEFFESKITTGTKYKQWYRKPTGWQVILNYCFGHRDSTLLLLPYGSGINYINHGNKSTANIKVQWADERVLHDPRFFKMSPEAMFAMRARPSLALEYIAIKDIAEGEELFLDYGPTWEHAWQDHVKHWTPPLDSNGDLSRSAAEWNAGVDIESLIVRTEYEQKFNPYPDHIEIRCHSHILEYSAEYWADLKFKRYDNEGDDGYETVYGFPCKVLERLWDEDEWDESQSIYYVVDIFPDALGFAEDLLYDWDEDEETGEESITLQGVPREAIFFSDAPYHSDLYVQGAFRHSIDIPDHMMPAAWRNKESRSPSPSDEL